MIHVLNKYPELTLFIQEIKKDKKITIRAGARYCEVSVGDKFDCVFDLDKGSILKTVVTEVTTILYKDESVLELPKGKSGEIGLSISEKEYEWLKGILKTKKVLLCRKDNIEFNIYSKDVISLEQTQNNDQVQKMLPHLGLEPPNDSLLFIAKAVRNDIFLNDQFNLIWNMDKVENRENNPIRLKAIYSRNLQPEKILYRGVPTLVLLSTSTDDFQAEKNLNLLYSLSNHLMIGKRVMLSDSVEGEEDLG
ncbi:MAG: hypothetical protein Sapg2KO_47850 [Saprospiraceae bacterium]